MSVGDPLGPVMIGAREIYEAVLRLGTKVDALGLKADLQAQQMTAHTDRGDDHETRIRSLEKARWPLPAIAILVSIAAVVVSVLHR